jgi:hypothetical protein
MTNFGMQILVVGILVFSIANCDNSLAQQVKTETDAGSLVGQQAFDYLKGLKGKWVVDDGVEGKFGWEFDVTSRGSVVIERLKVGTETEMTTVYFLDGGKLHAQHYCQLINRPHLTAVSNAEDGDVHFLCNEKVGGTKSHNELHMHGVHFQKKDDSVLIWMDMVKDGKVAFQTKFKLVRADSD